jgi:hypothetical protein
MSDSVGDDEQPMVEAEVSRMIEEAADDFDPGRHADAIDTKLAAGPLEPNDPPFWRAVVAELRRRAREGG